MTNERFDAMHISLLIPKSSSYTTTNKTGSWSFMRPRYQEKTAPCSARCPCGQDIPRIEMLVSRGGLEAAWRTILAENPLPGTCGRVCFHPCEEACNRGEFDAPVSINALERFLDDAARDQSFSEDNSKAPPKGKRVAIVGSGPASLSAAYFLARLGYECEIFEAGEAPGGVLRGGIPSYRLPNATLDCEIRRIEGLGVTIHYSAPVSPEFIASARSCFDAVFLGCGHGKPTALGIPGEELALDGLEFLNKSKNGSLSASIGSALVIGGGNSAIDVARSLLRSGTSATIVYRRRRDDMPAFSHEIARAVEEGVKIVELSAPAAITRKGKILELTVRKMRPTEIGTDGRMRVVPIEGQTEILAADAIYSAVGASAAEAWMLPPQNPEVLHLSHSAALWNCPAGIPLLYGGDPVNEEESVADAIASGKQAAIALDVFFTKGQASVEAEIIRCKVGDGTSLSMEIYLGGARQSRANKVVRFEDLNDDYFVLSERQRGASVPAEVSVRSFAEIESCLDEAGAAKQAERCFNCGICNDCDNCRTYCPEVAVFAARAARGGNWTEDAGVDREVNVDYCKGCGVCVTECPRCAMVIEEQQS